MLLRVFAVAVALSTATPTPELSAWNRPFHGSTQTERVEVVATVPPEDTINEFLPEERGLGECISAVPKPGCGSKARGGWRQGLVLLVILSGLGFIAWRVVRSARRARVSTRPEKTPFTTPTDQTAAGASRSRRSTPIATVRRSCPTVSRVTPDDFRVNGHQMIDLIADYLESVGERRVVPDLAPGEVRAMLPEHPPAAPEPWDAVRADIDRVVLPGITHWQHPNWFAYFPANTTYSSILGDLLSAGLGVQGMSWVTSPACTEIETLMLDWMQELLGLPERFRSTSEYGGGVIQGSASEAVLVAILAARWRATGGAVNTDGDTSRLVAYSTSQANSSVEKGLRIAGIGTDRIRIVEHDEMYAMRPESLAAAVADDVAAGFTPFFVCTTHGTTSSMAFDPTPDIAVVCTEHDVWLHVDGAMSGIAALTPEHHWVNAGIELADSYCTNPHKWMGVNFDCTLFWTADRAALLGALSILPEYLRSAAAESGVAIDYRDWQVPLGRRFRALKLWFTIRLDGIAAVQKRIRRDVALTQELAGWVADDERFEIVAPHPLNLVCLRLTGEDADARTDELIDRINDDGEFHVTRTVLDDRSVLRVSIGARTTEREHVVRLWSALAAARAR